MGVKKIAEPTSGYQSAIAGKIQSLMESHQLSLAKVASATGLTAEAIRQIVNGTIKNPGIETLSKIADAFSISLIQLLDSRNVTEQVSKKSIKIIDIFDLQKLKSVKKIDELIQQSVETADVLYIDQQHLQENSFAVAVNQALAEKLNHSGMPMLKQGDLLIFLTQTDYMPQSIVLVKSSLDSVILGIVMEIEDKQVWIKSVDTPQKQLVIKIKKSDIIGIVNNVQFKQVN